MWFSGRLISQLDHPNRAKDSWRRDRGITDTKRDEEDDWERRRQWKTRWEAEGQKIDTGKEKERGSYREGSPARDNMAQSESGLIGHRYLEKCKVGPDSAGYLQTERYYTLLIGSAVALLINQGENRHREQRRKTRRGGGGE